MSAVPVLMLLVSAGMKLAQPPGLAEGFAHLGWPVSKAVGLGVLELVCTVVYLVPRTSVLGAILLTGYLGGRRRRMSAWTIRILPRRCWVRWCGAGCICAMSDCERYCRSLRSEAPAVDVGVFDGEE